jgi:hypothetical protein
MIDTGFFAPNIMIMFMVMSLAAEKELGDGEGRPWLFVKIERIREAAKIKKCPPLAKVYINEEK